MRKQLTYTQQLIKEKRKLHNQLCDAIELALREKRYDAVNILNKKVNDVSDEIMKLEDQDFDERNGK